MSKTGRSSLRLRSVCALVCDGPIHQPSREGHGESTVEGSTTSARRGGSFRGERRWRCTSPWRPVAWPVPAADRELAGGFSKGRRHRSPSRVASAGGVSLRFRHATHPSYHAFTNSGGSQLQPRIASANPLAGKPVQDPLRQVIPILALRMHSPARVLEKRLPLPFARRGARSRGARATLIPPRPARGRQFVAHFWARASRGLTRHPSRCGNVSTESSIAASHSPCTPTAAASAGGSPADVRKTTRQQADAGRGLADEAGIAASSGAVRRPRLR